MSNWRLLALDMDGTLLHKDGTISEENKKWIRRAREAGIEVMLATGRHIFSVRFYMEELQLTQPAVTVNGGEIWKDAQSLLERHSLALEDVQFLAALAEEAKKDDTYFWSYTAEEVFRGTFPPALQNYSWLKVCYQNENRAAIEQLLQQLRQHGSLEISNSHPTNVEVNPLGITKAYGLRQVCRYLGLQPEQVITIGDSLNDIAMLRWAGLGIAMGNAQEEVKAVADRVTARQEENGVARAIEKILAAEW